MYKLIYMGGYNPQIFEQILEFEKLQLVGCILDYTLPQEEIDETKKKMDKAGIPELYLADIPNINPDIIFLCGYTKILKTEMLEKYRFINIHAGILPKWRGFNANCWAMLNGENNIGYTIHRVSAELDAGDIYSIISIQLEKNETYASGRDRIKEILCNKLEQIFVDIASGKLLASPQNQTGIVYNCRLRKTDGNICEWNRPTTYIVGLFRVFGVQPQGTGVRMYIKNEEFTIIQMEAAEEIAISVGIPGSVIYKYEDGSVLIKTMDTAVKVTKLQDAEGNIINPGNLLKIGMRL